MAKQLMFDQEAQRKIQQGVRQLARAVKITLGPTGKNVLLQKSFGGFIDWHIRKLRLRLFIPVLLNYSLNYMKKQMNRR